MKTDFDQFFREAMGQSVGPYDYQRRLASGVTNESCQSQLIHVPTGLGKTAGVVLAWLWNRLHASSSPAATGAVCSPWPRRLVYCLPMRTLVGQTRDNVKRWLENLAGSRPNDQTLKWLSEHSPVVLMGGEDLDAARREWDIHPERPCILIGTQDMLLSRALNRGYGMSRYRWPMHFGLLNHDCLWVMDEVQLMGVGVETSVQMQAFRDQLGGQCATWWMSATPDPAQLATVDHPMPSGGWPTLRLGDTDLRTAAVQRRIKAAKALKAAPVVLSPTSKKTYARELGDFALKSHEKGTLTLLVVNRVPRAQDLYRRLLSICHDQGPVALVHSRFRPADRAQHEEVLRSGSGGIVVATQAVEAGVDVSALTLVTEVAPWPSMVQRFGRCNRAGEHGESATVFWVRVEAGTEELAWPYDPKDLTEAAGALEELADVGIEALKAVALTPPRVPRPVIRRKDLIDLFDTTADLCGADLDISRYVRDGEDTDVRVFWRELSGKAPTPEEPSPIREELCAVPCGQFRQFVARKTKRIAYVWNPLDETWQKARFVMPGFTYLLDVETGGYSDKLGWTGAPADKPSSLASPRAEQEDGHDRDSSAFIRAWVDLPTHTADVLAAVEALSKELRLESALSASLASVAQWHDVGKAHPVFQGMLLAGAQPPCPSTLWAKSDSLSGKPSRRGFRHELASALAWLKLGAGVDKDLVAYLIAAHHGKIRLSIRPLPEETVPREGPTRLHARGIWQDDELPALKLGGLATPVLKLDLDPMILGAGASGESWSARMLRLRDQLGPFRLAFLETVIRAADGQASAKEEGANL